MILPGPGIPLVVAGLGLLSLEFEWARRLRSWLVRRTERVTPKHRGRRIALGLGALAASAAAAVAVAVWGLPGR